MFEPPSRIQAARLSDGPARGRGAQINPANRFERIHLEVLGEHLDHITSQLESPDDFTDGRQVVTHVYRDHARTVINRVDSPDLHFNWTINPYRGCEHGCVYCYARPTHETLGFSSGLDFETKLLAKTDAPELLRAELARPKWPGEPIMMSGVTDCYQPVEAKLRITRRCLEVMAEANQPVSIVTKNKLVLRDLDLLEPMARKRLVHVALSITSMDNRVASTMEPRASSPRDRLDTVRKLADAGVPVTVMVAPIIPAINDREVPRILEAVADAGATNAGFVLLRLPYANKDIFEDWLAREFPDRKDHVLSLMKQSHGGKLYDATWNARQRGSGPYAEQIESTFRIFARRHGLDRSGPPFDRSLFRHPATDNQLPLFG